VIEAVMQMQTHTLSWLFVII